MEWVKSRARMHRWEEEVELTLEEMCHVLCYMDWCAEYWCGLVSLRKDLDTTVQEGTAAYAEKQAYIVRAMARNFSQQWVPVLDGHSIVPDWPECYRATTTS